MEFREVVRQRRMVRRYTHAPVADEVVERVLATARRAPSAGFAQGQHFVVVTDRARRHAIAQLADEHAHVAAGREPWLSHAPVHVVVCTDERAYHRRYRDADKRHAAQPATGWPVPYWFVDAGAALQLLLLAAVDEGLGAGLLGVHRLPGLSGLLGIPEGVHPVALVTLGYAPPDQPAGSASRGWRPWDEVVHRERWD